MAENNDDIEQKMDEFQGDLPEMEKLAEILKMKFTNREGGAARLLSRLSRNLDNNELATRATQEISYMRRFREDVMGAYEIIALHDRMSEDLFSREYQPKMDEMTGKLEELEITYTQCMAEARENKRQRVAEGLATGGHVKGGLATGGLPENPEYSEEIEDEKEVDEKCMGTVA